MSMESLDASDSPTAVVVGGSRGFGLGITRALQARGFEAITLGRSPSVSGVKEHFQIDVSDREGWRKLVAQLGSRKDLAVSVLVYTVGYARVHAFDRTPCEEWDEHLWMNFSYIAESFPVFEKHLTATARVATTGSQWSHQNGWPELIPYIAAKHALATVTREYAMAFPKRLLRHYCVPTMATEGYQRVVESANRSGANLHLKSAPLAPAKPANVAEAFVADFLSATPSLSVICDIRPSGTVSSVMP
jgi:NAD(P)-dependent dehydrogenase (short-subunit alcohol dehydrogenase family)